MNIPNSTAKNVKSNDSAVATSPRSYRIFILMAILYAAWLIGLTYVGLVNYQAGNQ